MSQYFIKDLLNLFMAIGIITVIYFVIKTVAWLFGSFLTSNIPPDPRPKGKSFTEILEPVNEKDFPKIECPLCDSQIIIDHIGGIFGKDNMILKGFEKKAYYKCGGNLYEYMYKCKNDGFIVSEFDIFKAIRDFELGRKNENY